MTDKTETKVKARPRPARRMKLTDTANIGLMADLFGTPGMGVAPLPDGDRAWRDLDATSNTLDKLTTPDLISLLVDVSPPVSRAVHDFLRFCNPGWDLKVLDPKTGEPDEEAKQALERFLADQNNQAAEMHYGGSTGTLFNRLFMGVFVQGAVCAELVMDERGDLPIKIVDYDATAVRFKRITDSVLGKRWQLGYVDKNRKWVALEYETIAYVPLDPQPGKPYGRPMVTPAIFSALFLMGLLRDLRRVVSQQGYTRYHISVLTDVLLKTMPEEMEDDDDAAQKWIDDSLDAIVGMYQDLEPDEAFVTTDAVKVERPGGALSDSSIAASDTMIKALDRMVVQGLKTMPQLLGISTGATEITANRQWEIYASTIKSIQQEVENAMGHLMRLALEAMGIVGQPKLRFATLRASEELRDAQTMMMKISNALNMYLNGWISQDAASQMITGSDADQKAPRIAGVTGGDDLVYFEELGLLPSSSGDYGYGDGAQLSNLELAQRIIARGRQRVHARLATEGQRMLPDLPLHVEISDTDIQRALARWNALMPAYIGMLNASSPYLQSSSAWSYDPEAEVYEKDTGRRVDQEAMQRLRDVFIERLIEQDAGVTPQMSRTLTVTVRNPVAEELAEWVAEGLIDASEWLLRMRTVVKDAYIAEYVLARGGRNMMTAADWGRIGRMMAPDGQYAYLQKFANKIESGEMTAEQIARRANLYFQTASTAFERGKAAARSLTMPQYPGDGRQKCKIGCKCNWRYEKFDDRWECYWELDESAEHCGTCLDNADNWSPLVFER